MIFSKVAKLQPHSFLTKDPRIEKQLILKHNKSSVYKSYRKHPDQEKTFQNIYLKDPKAVLWGKAKA